jgi:hypothetical protein
LIGFPFQNAQPLAMDLWGRSGGMMHLGFDRAYKADRTDAEKANDVALVAYDAAPAAGDLEELKTLRSRGCYVVGLGARGRGDLADAVAACDAWVDTGAGGGNGACLSNLLHGWCLTAETVAALTRQAKMPPVWKGFMYDDGQAWAEKYFQKKQFHDDLAVPPVAAGELARAYLRQVRHPLRRLRADEPKLVDAGAKIADEWRAGRKTVIAWSGHLGYAKPSPFQRPWSQVIELVPSLSSVVDGYRNAAPRGALVLRLGDYGRDPREADLMRQMDQRVILVTGDHPDPARRRTASDAAVAIDLGYAFGDACVPLDGYPLRILAPSGVVQLAAFGAIEVEVRRRGGE